MAPQFLRKTKTLRLHPEFRRSAPRHLRHAGGTLALALAGICMTGCSGAAKLAAGKVAEIALATIGVKPTEAPPLPKPPKTLSLRLEGSKDLNAGEDGQGLTAVVRVYKLRDANSFMAAPYASFGMDDKEKQAIGPDLLEVKELVLSPGQILELKEKMEVDVAYLGVAALFRAPSPRRWRFAFAAADAEKSRITVGVHACAMTSTHVAPVGMTADEASLLSSTRCK